jgi:two-component system sensor histidine kinase/response regulator
LLLITIQSRKVDAPKGSGPSIGASFAFAQEEEKSLAMSGAKILIVEDESIVVMELRERLKRLGYEVMGVASSGEEAILKAEELHPDMVLMDIRLQGQMNGIQAAEAVRSRFDIPVVYLTAFADDDTLQKARMTEPFGYLIKPFEERQLHSTLEMALQKHKLEAALRESQRHLRLYADRLRTLHQIDLAILAAQSPETIAHAALGRIRQLVPCVRASVVTFDFEAQKAAELAVHDNGEATLEPGGRCPLEEYGDLEVLRQGQVQVIEDILAVLQPPPVARRRLSAGIRSCVRVPLMVQGEVIGCLDLGAAEVGAFSQAQIEILGEVANSLAVAIHQAQLRRRVARYVAELEERNEELDAFAQTVAHNLRNSVGVILGFADTALKLSDQAAENRLRRPVQAIAQYARGLNSIVEALLLLARVRREEVYLTTLDMATVIGNARRRLAYLIEEYEADITLPDTWPVALGYAPWVEEVWANYLSNALKYGGRPPRVELGATEQADGMVRFWVRDNGPGIPPKDQKRLFKPFTRLKREDVEGHGLGLSIVRRIVERLGGEVSVESELGRGSVFSFTLPGVNS